MKNNWGVVFLALIGEIMFPLLSVTVVITAGNVFLSLFMIFLSAFMGIFILKSKVNEKPLYRAVMIILSALLTAQAVFSLFLSAIWENLYIAKYSLFVFSVVLLLKLIIDYSKASKRTNNEN